MDYQVNRFVIEVSNDDKKSSTDQLDMDFFLQPERRKVILGTVRFPDGKPAPCSIVKFFRLKHPASDPDDISALETIGHAITDDNGQFLLGPVFPGEKIVIKVFYLNAFTVQTKIEAAKGTREPGH